jgi:alcohol dehydrogenase
MRAIVYNGKEAILKDMPKPIITETQTLIRVKSAGICGTDLAIIRGHLPTPTPIILGHEFVGIVETIGKKVDKRWAGKQVAVEINSNIDHSCFYCERGFHTQCVGRKALGIDIDGGFADYIAVEAYLLHEVPQSISMHDATFIEPLAAAYQTFEKMPLGSDDKTMVIFGMGKLGLLILQVAKQKGLTIIAVDGSDVKLALAKKWGAYLTLNRNKITDIVEIVRNETHGLGADIVVDTSGNPDALKEVVASCRTLGKIHMKSTHGLATPLNITDIVVREIAIYSSRCGPFEKAITGLQSGQIHVQELISKVFPLDQYEQAIKSYDESHDHIKTILDL